MKICIAQTQSFKGQVEWNIQNHINFIERAIEHDCSLIVFPELSLTNYEPSLAQQFVDDTDESIFHPFQQIADKHGIAIAVGAPSKADNGIHISLMLFRAEEERAVYSKQMLHTDELPYFIAAHNDSCYNLGGTNIAFGICYETLQTEHFLQSKKRGGEIYIASVAKPERGVEKAVMHFSATSQAFGTPILMSNAVGSSDNFVSAGQSAVWSKDGRLLGQLDRAEQGFIIYDTFTETAAIHHFESQTPRTLPNTDIQ